MVAASPSKTSKAADQDKLTRLRAQMPAVSTTGYFNAGTNGPLPQIVHDTLVAASERELRIGRIVPTLYPEIMADLKRNRGLFADLFNADPSEIALTRCTSDGLSISLMGLTWRPGDEIITVQSEHVCLFSGLGLVAHRYGVVIKSVDIGNGGGDVTGIIEKAITSRTRAIAISHVQWSTGSVMPLKEIGDMAAARNILTIVDAAQAAGQIAIDLHDLNVDAYAMPGQKWLCGPVGSGALYVRSTRISEIQPTYLRYGAFDPTGFVIPPAGAARYEGETYNPEIKAQAAGLEWLRDEVGLDWLYARVLALGKRCHDGLRDIPGVSVITPENRMAGLVSFSIGDKPVKEFSDAVFQRGHTIRYVDQRPGPAAVRVSTGWWCTEDEVDDLVKVIGEIARA